MKRCVLCILIIPIIFFVYAVYTIDDYGINWDEPYHFRRGQAFLQFYLTGKKTYDRMPKYPPLKGTSDSGNFRDSEQFFREIQQNPTLSDPTYRRSFYQDDAWNGEYHIDIENPSGHPALNGILAALFNKIFYQKLGILGDLESYHLFEIMTASFLVFFVALFMYREFGVVGSVVSSLALATYPLFLGEQHFNIKDPIVATFYTLTLVSLYKAVTKRNSQWLLISIIVFAFGLSVKFNIVFALISLGVWAFAYFLKNRRVPKFEKKFYLFVALAPLIVFLLFILFFPTLWKNPLQGTLEVINYYIKIGYSSSQLNNQNLVGSVNTSPLLWILYTTPVVTLILFVSIFLFPRKLLEHNMFPFLLITTLTTTLLRVALPGTISYGGVRQIMEYIPVVAMLCGISASWIFEKNKKLPLGIVIIMILLAYTSVILRLIAIHPNENVYFNIIAGGLVGAKKKNLDSWGNSYGNAYFPAITWLNNHAEENAKLTIPVGSTSNIPRFKLREDIAVSTDYWSGSAHEGEYVLELTHNYEPMKWYSLNYLNAAIDPVYEVSIDGVAIAKLWKNSPEYVKPPYKNQKEIASNVLLENDQGILKLTLPKREKVMQLSLSQPTENCNAIITGYIDTSINGYNWEREIEDIAREQLKHARLRRLETDFVFYFVARDVKYLRIHSDNPNSCILKSSNPIFIVLDEL